MSGWKGATEEERAAQVREARRKHWHTPVCSCYLCHNCQSNRFSTVHGYEIDKEARNPVMSPVDVPVCWECGYPAFLRGGTRYDFKHTKTCPLQYKNYSGVGINPSDLALLGHLLAQANKVLKNMMIDGENNGSM